MAGRGLEPGTLWRAVLERTAHALRAGTLRPIPTESRVVEDAGVRFLVRIASELWRKEAASTYRAKRDPWNPFRPYEEDLFVAPVSDTHIALLNKFNVLEHHLLIVTREFEEQEAPLSGADLSAMWNCLAEYDALAFYNSGEIAGASQRHKHLQLVPLPMAAGVPGCPIDALIQTARPGDEPATSPALPFPHALCGVSERSIERPLETYRALLGAAGVDPDAPAPYNLLVTREWMLAVPRSRECFHTISINALGYAGSFFVKTEAQLALLRAHGPLAALTRSAGV